MIDNYPKLRDTTELIKLIDIVNRTNQDIKQSNTVNKANKKINDRTRRDLYLLNYHKLPSNNTQSN